MLLSRCKTALTVVSLIKLPLIGKQSCQWPQFIFLSRVLCCDVLIVHSDRVTPQESTINVQKRARKLLGNRKAFRLLKFAMRLYYKTSCIRLELRNVHYRSDGNNSAMASAHIRLVGFAFSPSFLVTFLATFLMANLGTRALRPKDPLYLFPKPRCSRNHGALTLHVSAGLTLPLPRTRPRHRTRCWR